jgi:hypothetical protein
VEVVWCGRRGVWEWERASLCLLAPLETAGWLRALFVAALSLSMSPVDRPRHGYRAEIMGCVRTEKLAADLFLLLNMTYSLSLFCGVCITRCVYAGHYCSVNNPSGPHGFLGCVPPKSIHTRNVQAARSLQPSTGLMLSQS